MRYVDKSKRYTNFDDFASEIGSRLRLWEDLKSKRNRAKVKGNEIQLALFQHLWKQQKGLCVYCQQTIPEKKVPYQTPEAVIAQMEHICPQSHCEDLIFEQSNIVVSCEGFNLSEPTPTSERRNFCGHRRANDHNVSSFLNPTQISTIETYFSYSALGKIEANTEKNEAEQLQANYMISILGLDNSTLETMRQNEYIIWANYLNTYGKAWIDENLNDDFEELPAFFSMLKSKFL
jgi:uncharacterized protein (TIGR02646 family)